MKLDISGLNKVELLRKLHVNQKSAVFFAMNGMPAPSFLMKNKQKKQ